MSTPSESAQDRIERSVVLHVPRARVWQALANAEEFGRWFEVDLKGQTFAPGQHTRAPITTAGYSHIMFDVVIDRMEPEHLLSWRWHPYAVDPAADYSQEERTRVTFTLQDVPGGTRLTVVESGFDRIPAERREEAVRMNSRGWEGQMESIRAHATEA